MTVVVAMESREAHAARLGDMAALKAALLRIVQLDWTLPPEERPLVEGRSPAELAAQVAAILAGGPIASREGRVAVEAMTFLLRHEVEPGTNLLAQCLGHTSFKLTEATKELDRLRLEVRELESELAVLRSTAVAG